MDRKIGMPVKIPTDQGRQFLTDRMKKFCTDNSIRNVVTSAYNPTGNSVVERTHGTLGNFLRIYKDEYKVDVILKLAERNINWSYHKEINSCPINIIDIKTL